MAHVVAQMASDSSARIVCTMARADYMKMEPDNLALSVYIQALI